MGYGYGSGPWGMMNGWGYGYGGFHFVFWILLVVVVVFCVTWMMRSMGGHRMAMHRSAGLDVLEERYARGEINRDEYLQKKKDIVA